MILSFDIWEVVCVCAMERCDHIKTTLIEVSNATNFNITRISNATSVC